MRSKSLLTAILALPPAGLPAEAPSLNSLAVIVRETAGIRRGNFPTEVSVNIAQGTLHDAAHVRLLLDQQEVPVQALGAARWPDGSIRRLDLNFNASVGPLAELRYRLEFGPRVRAQPVVAEKLEVVETGSALQAGKVRFARDPAVLLQSVAFGREIIGDGLNAWSVIDDQGATHLLEGDVRVEIVKPGPLVARIRYLGAVQLPGDYAAPFEITLDVPNAKSWVKYSARVQDPGHRVRELALNSSFKLGGFPWTWDLGTGSWSYGVIRDAADSVEFKQQVGEGGADWQISTSSQGQERLYERAAGRRPTIAEGWGHLQNTERAVAFAIEDFAKRSGQYRVELDGHGQFAFRVSPATSTDVHTLAVYQHYVASPIPIGAATSPVAMSSPLAVTVESDAARSH